MDSQAKCRFPHRHNRDGSHDSICISCYATVASVRDEADLAEHEQGHLCDMVFLNYATQSCRGPGERRLKERAQHSTIPRLRSSPPQSG